MPVRPDSADTLGRVMLGGNPWDGGRIAYRGEQGQNRPMFVTAGGNGRLRGILRAGELSPMQVAACRADSPQDALQPAG